jgi:hypothetical protein
MAQSRRRRSDRAASRLLKNVDVRAELDKHQAQTALKYSLTHDKIIRDVIHIGECAFLDGDYNAALKAKHMAGRHVGMWPNKTEVTGPNGGPVPVMAATVVLKPEEFTPEQRNQIRAIMLKAKAKERAATEDDKNDER